jgi:hypothetical protein
MDKKELGEYLKDNLSFALYCTRSGKLEIELSLEDEVISSAEVYLPTVTDKSLNSQIISF